MRTSHVRQLVAVFLGLTLVLGVAASDLRAAAASDDDAFLIRPKDRIVFLGDSITEQYDYTNLLEYYLTTRFPAWDLTFYNAGIGGDTAGGGNNRAARDVLSEKPTVVLINFGMPDGGYQKPNDAIYNSYIKNQHALVKKLTDARVRVGLMATSPIEARKRNDGDSYNETLEKFCEGLKEVAAKHGATHVDQFHPAWAVLKKMAEAKAPFYCFPDSVHTNGAGGLLMAHAILTGLKAPAIVSDLSLDASGAVKQAERCKVSDFKVAGGKITFSRLDEALPMVISGKDQKELLPYLGNLSRINRYGLKITGLEKDSKYELTIDGKKVASFGADQLAKGIDLSLDNLGPITAQSNEVWQALLKKNQLLRWRFNNLRRSAAGIPPGLPAEEHAEFSKLQQREAVIVDRALETQQKHVFELAQPKAHVFELTAAR